MRVQENALSGKFETHLGDSAVMLRKPPAMHNIDIDIDP